MVYWHVTPKDDVSTCTALADVLHRYHFRIKGIEDNQLRKPEMTRGKYKKGDVVWVKNPRSKCTTKYNTGRVTEEISPQSVKIDEMPRHVKDLRPVIQTQISSSDESDSEYGERLVYLNSYKYFQLKKSVSVIMMNYKTEMGLQQPKDFFC